MQDIKQNYAFIDGQNLYASLSKQGVHIDYKKFRKYLFEKYKIRIALYFMGYKEEVYDLLYKNISSAGFKLIFKKHRALSKSVKKGNVDTGLLFEVMKKIQNSQYKLSITIVSGDGDYFKLVNYLTNKKYLKKILFPTKQSISNLYAKLSPNHKGFLDDVNIINKIRYVKKVRPRF